MIRFSPGEIFDKTQVVRGIPSQVTELYAVKCRFRDHSVSETRALRCYRFEDTTPEA